MAGKLPPEVGVAPHVIAEIVARFNLQTHTATRFAHAGTSHTVYFLDGMFVLRTRAIIQDRLRELLTKLLLFLPLVPSAFTHLN